MTTLVYITSSESDFDNLKLAIGTEYLVIFAHPDNFQIDPPACDLVLVDADVGLNQLLNLLTNIYSKFDFVDIPIIITAGSSHCKPFTRHLPPAVSGLIKKPFQTDQTASALDQFLRPAGSASCHDNLITLFSRSLVSVIETNLKQTPIETASYGKNNFLLYGDISAAMALSGDLFGSIAVAFPHELAILQAEKMTGCKRQELDEHTILEGVGEIINQIAGKGMTLASKSGIDFSISLPDIKVHAGRTLDHSDRSDHQVIIFELFGHPLALHLCLETTITIPTGNKAKAFS